MPLKPTDYLKASPEDILENMEMRLETIRAQAKRLEQENPEYGILLTDMVTNAVEALKSAVARSGDRAFQTAMEVELISVLYASGCAVLDLDKAYSQQLRHESTESEDGLEIH